VKYVLLIHWDENAGAKWTPAENQTVMEEHRAFGQALGSRLLAGERLQATSAAKRVTTRGGRRAVTEGPFTETKEVVGGYYVLECASAEEALEWAAKCPSSKHGTVEVRPVWG
jgi:hypothetical protein